MKTFGCELCGKKFLDSLRLRMHLLSHSAGAKAFVCDQCGAQFSKEDGLDAHRRTHTGKPCISILILCSKHQPLMVRKLSDDAEQPGGLLMFC
uniref:Zinc finger and BTB domain-containing protein 16-like n=1 Tax=Callorhinchus milii TaxID=7868 RepID=A0A4W3H3K2_CALMI